MPQLIALTPRAGDWNHRFLVSPDSKRGVDYLARVTHNAKTKAIGQNYISVQRRVTQTTGGRGGTEILVLSDVDLSQFDAEKIERLRKQLECHLDDLANLVTNVIDWDKEGQLDPVRRRELEDWLDVYIAPVNVMVSASTKDKKVKKGFIMAITIGTGLLIGTVALHFLFDNLKIPEKRDESEPIDSEVCLLLDQSRPCNIDEKGESFQSLCTLYGVESSKCHIQYVEEEQHNLKQIGFSIGKLKGIVDRYSERGGLDWKTFFDEDLTTIEQRQLFSELGVSDDVNRPFDDYVEILRITKEIDEAYQSIPIACRNEVAEDNLEVTLPDVGTLANIRNIKAVLEKVNENTKSNCVVRGFTPLKECRIDGEYRLMDVAKSKCLKISSDDKNNLKQEGYTEEVKMLDAIEKVFLLRGLGLDVRREPDPETN